MLALVLLRELLTDLFALWMMLVTDIHGPQRTNPSVFSDPPDFSSSINMRFTFVVLNKMSQQLLDALLIYLVHIHATHGMNYNNFGDRLTF